MKVHDSKSTDRIVEGLSAIMHARKNLEPFAQISEFIRSD